MNTQLLLCTSTIESTESLKMKHSDSKKRVNMMFYPGVTAEGVLSSPNFPGSYPNNLKKRETLRGGNGTVLVLKFTAFDVEDPCPLRDPCPSPRPCADHLKIQDGDGTTLMDKTCGHLFSLPEKITSRSNIVHLDFNTDGKGQMTGWKVVWRDITHTGVFDQHFNFDNFSL